MVPFDDHDLVSFPTDDRPERHSRPNMCNRRNCITVRGCSRVRKAQQVEVRGGRHRSGALRRHLKGRSRLSAPVLTESRPNGRVIRPPEPTTAVEQPTDPIRCRMCRILSIRADRGAVITRTSPIPSIAGGGKRFWGFVNGLNRIRLVTRS
jgi:hypothetical protein